MRTNRRQFMAIVGGATACSVADFRNARADTPKLGYISDEGVGPHPFRSQRPIVQALSQLGLVEGKNLSIEYRFVDGKIEKLPSLAAELVALPVNVIFAVGTPAAQAAVHATKTIPIIFARIGDPVAAGLVAGLPRPGGNATGVSVMVTELVGKRLQVLRDVVPSLNRLAILHEPNFLPGDIELKGVTAAAQSAGVQVSPVGVSNFSELEGAAEKIMQGSPQALFVGSSGWYEDQYQRILEVAAKTRLPTLYVRREFAEAGGLMSYGISYLTMYRTAAAFIEKILAGTRPDDLPVQYPTNTEFVINLKAAKAMGLSFPLSVQTMADSVLEQ